MGKNKILYKVKCKKCGGILVFELIGTEAELDPSYKITPDKSPKSVKIPPLDTLLRADSCRHNWRKERKTNDLP